MKIENHSTFELDDQLQKIDEINYLPWIGKQALEKANRLLEKVFTTGEKKKVRERRYKKDWKKMISRGLLSLNVKLKYNKH